MTSRNSFIETGVLIGYCVLLDPHHNKCSNYVDGNSHTLFTSKEVKTEYQNTKSKVAKRTSNGVLDHIRDLKGHSSQGYLGPMDINTIKRKILTQNNDAYEFLYDYYDNIVNNGVNKPDLEKNLRAISRDIARITTSRENQLNQVLRIYTANSQHPSVESTLSMIHHPDRKYAVQAHDLATAKSEPTEFATANPSDFIDNGRKQKILKNTDLDDIVDLSV